MTKAGNGVMESWSDALLTNHRHLPRIQYLNLPMALLRYSITPLLLAAAAFAETPQATLDAKHRAFFKDNCLSCHNAEKQKGKVRLDDIAFTVDTVVPVTTVSGKSRFKVKGRTALASFVFGPNETGVTFTCKVVTTGYKPCAKAFKARLRPGSYKLYVIATDAAGQTDATPALKSFRVVK